MKTLQKDFESKISLKNFLRDKIFFLIAAILTWGILILFMSAFKTRPEVIALFSTLGAIFIVLTLLIEYLQRRKFYQTFFRNLAELSQAYLVLETLERPDFYDGQILYDALYTINKSMRENVKIYQAGARDFREYVEMWIHEVKTPLATLALLSKSPQVSEQIKRLDDYVEQILYFARAENAERDYLISKVELAKVVGEVANHNRAMLQAQKINFEVSNLNYKVYTDGKWLEFILNQIINNSMKYQCQKIRISAERRDDKTALIIYDDGIGISAKDLPRVFDKSFTGSNGRIGKQSTGMGLYIAKTLCEKLGHSISIRSKKDQFTEVEITFSDDRYYDLSA